MTHVYQRVTQDVIDRWFADRIAESKSAGVKLCKDCRFYGLRHAQWIARGDARTINSPHSSDNCDHPRIFDPVTGINEACSGLAQTIRMAEGMCGMEGRWFEAKP